MMRGNQGRISHVWKSFIIRKSISVKKKIHSCPSLHWFEMNVFLEFTFKMRGYFFKCISKGAEKGGELKKAHTV